MSSLLIRNATVVTMNDADEVIEGEVFVEHDRIAGVGRHLAERAGRVIDAQNGILLPGLIQTHVHLCQTLFRGYADDKPLLEWLRARVWPMEAAHTPASLSASTRLAAAELLLSGTTAVLTMETVHDTDVVFETLAEVGLRATVGKCMMDAATDDVPARLREQTRQSFDESVALRRRWDGAAGGRLRAALAPRFALTCSRELLEAVAAESRATEAIVHTHASESRDEVELVRRTTGTDNVEYLTRLGLASPRLCAAHCVWVTEAEQRLLADHGVKVLHCPGSNLKLGSGIAPVPELMRRGVSVSIGADGAACNNNLDMFAEMRLAATLQAARLQPGALPARDVVSMATRHGARALGLEQDIGSIEVGKRADLVLVDRSRPHLSGGADPYSTIVYAARGGDVRTTIVDGEVLVHDFALTRMDAREIAEEARTEGRALAARAGVSIGGR
ncbi:MAG: 5'-deoxyadenosine deaminase [Acidobacteria bacterium]|nr:5'-deoxyadenosine deaminase [Acidobacteriota bacterium]